MAMRQAAAVSGWIKLYRGWRDSQAFADERMTEREAWLWLLEHAAWRDTHRRGGKGDVVLVRRGQLHSADRTLAGVFGWDRKRVGRFMQRLEKFGMATQSKGHSGMLITICNYEIFQSVGADDGAIVGADDGAIAGPSRGHRGATQEEGKERKEGKEEDSLPSGVPPANDDAIVAFADFEAMRREIDASVRPLDPTTDRRKKLALRLQEIGGLDPWREVLASIRGSPFLRGESSRTGRPVATIDWLLKPENLRKVREGNYDGRNVSSDRNGAGGGSKPQFRDPLFQRIADGNDPYLDSSGRDR